MVRMFDFKCLKCVHEFEAIVRDDEIPRCPECGYSTKKLPSKINVNMGVGAYGYYDENLETYIHTNKHRREVCREQGVTPKGDTPKPDGEAWV